MASSNATILAAIRVKYTQFASNDDAQIEAFLDDARLLVPLCNIPTARQDLALMYKALALMTSGAGATATGSGIKREKSGDVEIEYSVSSTTGQSANQFEQMYQSLVRPFSRNSPRVLNGR